MGDLKSCGAGLGNVLSRIYSIQVAGAVASGKTHVMARLRRVSVSSTGYSRQLSGDTVAFFNCDGIPLDDEAEIARCEQLAVPPAWQDVWICKFPHGHIQAFGYDDAGRGQYIYHQQWRERRDRAKHDHVLEVARRLPAARGRVTRALKVDGMPRTKALALAFRLLDLAYFRAGSEVYARTNKSYGLATIRKEHAVVHTDGTVEFQYPAKSGQLRQVTVDDEAVRAGVTMLKRRQGGKELLAYREGAVWRDIRSSDVQEVVHDLLGDDATPKDFRTWHATVLAAQALAAAGDPPSSAAARRRVMAAVVREVATALGNTPAVARKSYIDARLFDLWERGKTIGRTRSQSAAETAVLELLG